MIWIAERWKVKLKIAVDLRKLSRKPSGIGMYTYNFVKEMLKYSDLCLIGICDVSESSQIKELKKYGMEIIEYSHKVDKSYQIFKYFKFIEKVLIKEKPDFFWEPNFIIPRNLKKNVPEIKMAVNIHDITPIVNKKYYSIIYRNYFKIFLNYTINNSDMFIFISEDTKKSCNNKFKKLRSKPQLMDYVIVENNCNNELHDDEYFLYVGNIENRKGIDILLEAYKKYIEKGGQNNLKLCGNIRDKKLKVKLSDYICKYKNRIEYYGYVDENKKYKLLSKCSAFVFPSFAEGFGIPPIEALYLGKPVIVSDIDVFKETMGVCANYFKLDDNNVYDSINSLSETLFDYAVPKYEDIQNLKKKYDKNLLTQNMIKFFKNNLYNKEETIEYD